MPFVKQLPHWGAPGIEPPLSLRQNGWKAGVKPPDEYFNYLQNRAYEALKELQENAVHKDDAGSGVTNLGFRGLLADPNGIGGPVNIDKYPEGLSVLYTDSPDWAVFLNMTDFVSALEFLFVETNKTIQDGKVNATQQITRYKKESNATPVKLISQYKRVWYSDANYTGWSNAEKVVFQTEFATHLAEDATIDKKGHVQLSNLINGSSEKKAATEKSVKDALADVRKWARSKITEGHLQTDPNTTDQSLILVQGHPNAPTGGIWYIMTNIYAGETSARSQIAISYNRDYGRGMYWRDCFAEIWQPWVKIVDMSMVNVPNGVAGLDGNGQLSAVVAPKLKKIGEIDLGATPTTSFSFDSLSIYKKLQLRFFSLGTISITSIWVRINDNTLNYEFAGAFSGGSTQNTVLSVQIAQNGAPVTGNVDIENEGAITTGNSRMMHIRPDYPNLQAIDFGYARKTNKLTIQSQNGSYAMNKGIVELWGELA